MSMLASLRALEHQSLQQWLDRMSRTLPQALSLVLVVAIAWQLVQLTWLLLDRGTDIPASVSAPPSLPAGIRQGPDIQAIVNAHLFGVQQAATSIDPSTAPQTQMNLVLSAVFATNDPSKGLAIIGESAAAADVYKVGEAVRPGTLLHAVYADRVILDRGGQLEALALPMQSMAGVQLSQAPAVRQGASQLTENLRRLAEASPSAIAEVIRPQPVFANGVQRGYRVYPGRNRQMFARLGLQPGDLVTTINGTPLDDPQRGMEIFNTMANSDRVTVTVERAGQSQDLTLNMAQMSLPQAVASPDPNAGQAPRATRGPQPAPNSEGPSRE